MISKWDIWLANLDPVIGSEQGKTRPVLIISNEDVNKLLNVVNVLPITSKKHNRIIYPNEVLIVAGNYGLIKDSIIMCQQIRTLDKVRMISKIGIIDESETRQKIIKSLTFQLIK